MQKNTFPYETISAYKSYKNNNEEQKKTEGSSFRRNASTCKILQQFHVETGTNEFIHRDVILNRSSKLVNEKLINVDINFLRISQFKQILKEEIFSYQTR